MQERLRRKNYIIKKIIYKTYKLQRHLRKMIIKRLEDFNKSAISFDILHNITNIVQIILSLDKDNNKRETNERQQFYQPYSKPKNASFVTLFQIL